MQWCNMQKRIYDASVAEQDTTLRRTTSRDGIRVSKPTFDKVNSLVSKLVKQGQSIDVILANNREITISKSTIYDWIKRGYMDVKPIDLRRAVRYKTAKTLSRVPKISNSNYKLGHKYPDFLAYVKDHPNANIVEIDTVYGNGDDSKRILTIHFKYFHFQFGILIDNSTANNVNESFLTIKKRLFDATGSHSLYQAIFDVLLTDNGAEFSNLLALEFDDITGEIASHIFYCDPQNSQQKGSCERNHELIRYISEKGVSIQSLTQRDIELIFSHINSYSRLSINHKTPFELVHFTFGQVFLDSINITQINSNDVILTPQLLQK